MIAARESSHHMRMEVMGLLIKVSGKTRLVRWQEKRGVTHAKGREEELSKWREQQRHRFPGGMLVGKERSQCGWDSVRWGCGRRGGHRGDGTALMGPCSHDEEFGFYSQCHIISLNGQRDEMCVFKSSFWLCMVNRMSRSKSRKEETRRSLPELGSRWQWLGPGW
jgi:hypothetical protein